MEQWDKEFLEYQRMKEGLSSVMEDDEYRAWDERFLQLQQDPLPSVDDSQSRREI